MSRTVIGACLSLVGAAIGGTLGVGIFTWLYYRGFYAMVIPGACLGFGAMLLSRNRSMARGVILGLLGVGLGLITEWRFFHNARTLPEFLSHISDLGAVEYLMIGVGGLVAFWCGRDASPWLRRSGGRPEPVQVKHAVERD